MKSYLGWVTDYTKPAGEPGLAGPESVTWQIFRNPVCLAAGGICAVLLELADPRIRTGVWTQSSFSRDPAGRLQRTATAARIGAFAPASAARMVIGRITQMHRAVTGTTPDGESYAALDRDLLNWVSATASWSFLRAYSALVRPLQPGEQDRFFCENAPIARLYHASDPLRSLQHFDEMLDERLAQFEPHPIHLQFLETMRSGQAAPEIPPFMHRALVHTALVLLPERVRNRLDLPSLRPFSSLRTTMVSMMAQSADRIPDPDSPAAQACERLGLPRSFLWQSATRRAALLAARRLPRS